MTREHLLYVDDDPDIRAIVQMSLELDGRFDVTLADGGHAALKLISDGLRPDVIVLDVMMPGMDGPDLLRHLQSSDTVRSVPVLFMTAKGRQADVDRYLAQGARGVILKPFDPMRLAIEIGAFLT